MEKRYSDAVIKKSKDKKWLGTVLKDTQGSLNYHHYWAVRSVGFAAAASGEAHYLRPERKAGEVGDYPGKHWGNHELPQLKKDPDITVVKGFTFPHSTDRKYKGVELTPGYKARVGTDPDA